VNYRATCLLFLLAMNWAIPQLLSAQATTGRHRPARTEALASVENVLATEPRWFVTAGAGVLAGGDLFRVQFDGTVGLAPPQGPSFQSNDFVVTFDESFAMAVGVGYRLHELLWLRLNLATAQAGLTALAQAGQSARTYRWDQLNIVLWGLDAELRLVRQRDYPYLLGGCALIVADGVAEDQYDQTQTSLRFGGGYQKHLLPAWGLRAEVRADVLSLAFADYRPEVTSGDIYPTISVDEKSPHYFWELILALHGSF